VDGIKQLPKKTPRMAMAISSSQRSILTEEALKMGEEMV